MSVVISSFSAFSVGSQVFAFLMLFLWVILRVMWSGSSLQLLCIFPFGMLCLSASSMMLVNILFAVCMLVGVMFWDEKADSVSLVNCVQFAFL